VIRIVKNYPPPYVKRQAAWNDRYITDPVTVVITEVVSSWRWLTPSAVTLIAFGFAIGAWYMFLDPSPVNQVWGAILWQVNYLLDGVDGKLARKRSEFAPYGAQLDNVLDKVKKVGALTALVSSAQSDQFELMLLIVIHYALLRIPMSRSERVQGWFARRGARISFDPLDQVFIILFLGPIFGRFFEAVLVVVSLQLLDRLVNALFAFGERSQGHLK
jgi:phosphatidylglycerophosphate synthase